MNLKLGNSCGSCIHSNRPQTPREHAAHYEVAKTERWCFKHNCHTTREATCDDHEGTNRAGKTAFTRVIKYNQRLEKVKKFIEIMGDKEVIVDDRIYYVKDGWLQYKYDRSNYEHPIRSKDSSTDRHIKEILAEINLRTGNKITL